LMHYRLKSVKITKHERLFASLTTGLIFLATLNNICASQVVQDSTKNNGEKSFFSKVGGDISHVATSPFHMSKTEGIEFVSLIALSAGLVYGVDEPVDEELAVEGYHDVLKPAETLADLGYAYDQIGPTTVLVGATATLLMGGIIFKDRKLLETTRLVIESALITGVITWTSKGLFSRSRPYTNESTKHFHFFRFSSAHKYNSFPSGHSSNIFSLVTVITKQYPAWWLKVPAYTLAVSVGLQRIDDRQHWTSDVVVGSLLGYWVGSRLVNRYQEKSRGISISPYFQGNQIGIGFVF
jgi:membrane-associated phospholipid phosphatase